MPAFRVLVTAHISQDILVDAPDVKEAKARAVKQMQDSLWTNDIGFTEDYTAEAREIELAPIEHCWCGAEYDNEGLCPLRHEALTEDHTNEAA